MLCFDSFSFDVHSHVDLLSTSPLFSNVFDIFNVFGLRWVAHSGKSKFQTLNFKNTNQSNPLVLF